MGIALSHGFCRHLSGCGFLYEWLLSRREKERDWNHGLNLNLNQSRREMIMSKSMLHWKRTGTIRGNGTCIGRAIERQRIKEGIGWDWKRRLVEKGPCSRARTLGNGGVERSS